MARRRARIFSQVTPMARSAMPLSWWTCAGAKVRETACVSMSSKKRAETSSPPLSEWMLSTVAAPVASPTLAMRRKSASSRVAHSMGHRVGGRARGTC